MKFFITSGPELFGTVFFESFPRILIIADNFGKRMTDFEL